ncbi:DUF2786 domain-containing protein [Actinoplanes sp. NPDC049548]|uniref:DUF2786 domain-containing protein n=1 Tax=Actinoplanes sp. NPDC049548 TaxID=3155152 RepID=UPI00343BBDF4
MSDNKLAKIRALLAKAENPAATPAESEAYTAKATELIQKWGLEEAMKDAAEEVTLRAADRIMAMEGHYQRDKADLLWGIANAMGCQGVVIPKGHRGSTAVAVHLFGMDGDLDRVDLLFTSLLVQAAHGMATAQPWSSSANIKAYRRSWLAGFRRAVTRRLEAQRRRAADETGPGTDLVLADRSALVKARRDEVYPKTVRRPRRLTGSGFHSGYAAGQRANLGGASVTNRPGMRAVGSR